MDQTLKALADILLKAIPTFVLVVLLHFYIKHVFFKPLERVLQQRRLATEGVRRHADELFARASQKAADYEAALRRTRAEIYQEFEELRHELRKEHEAAVVEARRSAAEIVKRGKEELELEAAIARKSLERASDLLAARIADSMFKGRLN